MKILTAWGRRVRRLHGRAGERGTIAVFTALLITMTLGFAALLVDLGQLRATARNEQLYVDFAALAAGKQLSFGSPNAACKDAITYLNTNDTRITTAINAASFCSAISNTCNSSTAEVTPSTTVNEVTVSVHFPVPESEISDSRWGGAGLNDGLSQCQRMRVLVTTADKRLFSRIFGGTRAGTTRSATTRPNQAPGSPPALWVLDPTGCVPLKVDGGSQVTVGTSSVQGIITVDSDGTTCTGSSTTISSSGSGTLIQAVGPPSGGTTGKINLVALPAGSSSCSIPACDPADVSGGRIAPQPSHGEATTRSYIDWIYNCKTGYPTFHGQTIYDCPYTAANGGTSYAYIDNLNTAIGSSGTPATGTWTTIGPSGTACAPSASITYPPGNYYVKCTRGNNGFVVNGGVTVTFQGGNVVFEDNITVSNGGTLNINTGTDPTRTDGSGLPSAMQSNCIPPTVQTPCVNDYSSNAAFVYIRGDNSTQLSTSGSGAVNFNHVFVYGGTGSVAFSGAPPKWTAPQEGPFTGLAYWTDMPSTASSAQRSSFTITGGSGANLEGTFFTPEAAPFKLAGGGNWGQQHAQFISYQLTVTGGGILTMAPDDNSVKPPFPKGFLIR